MNVEKNRQYSLYSTIFIKITLLLIMIVLLSGISLTVYYSKIFLNNYINRDHEELNVINRYYQNFINSIRGGGSVIITDPDVHKLIFDDELLTSEVNEILLKIKNLLASSPYIEFVNFYIPEKSFYYSSYSKQKESGNILDSIDPVNLTSQNIKNFNPIPMNIKLDNDLYTIYLDMLVFILPISRQENSPYLTIFIDAEKFSKIYKKETNSELIIFNNNNDVICHTGQQIFGIKKQDLNISSEIDEAIKKNGKIYKNILNNDLNIISIIKEDNYTIVKNSSIMPFVRSIRTVIINSGIVILIIILTVYFLASKIFKKLYSPIQSLLSRLHQLNNFKHEDKTDLEIINFLNIEAESVSQIETLRNFREQNTTLVRNRYLNHFLNGKLDLNNQEDINNFIQRIDSPFNKNDFFKILTCSFKQNIENYYSNLLLRGLIKQFFSQYYTTVTFISENNDYITIISSKENFNDQEIIILCEEFISFMKKEQPETAEKLHFISIGDTCRDFFQLPFDYEKIKILNGSSYKYADKLIITNSILEKDKLITALYPISIEQKIIKSIKNHNCNEALEFIDQFFERLKYFDHISIFNFIIRFISSLITNLQMIETKSKINFEIHFNTWFRSIIKSENMKVAENEIKGLIGAVQLRFSFYKKTKTENYAKIIMNLIDQDYTDPNLCINLIADKINLSPAYCGQIFRKIYSISILDYILSLRLEKAIEIMIMEPARKINEISLAIGIQNYRYFYTKFKLTYGVTPGDYRKSNKKGIENKVSIFLLNP